MSDVVIMCESDVNVAGDAMEWNGMEWNFALESTNRVPNGRFAREHKPTPLGP